MEVAVPVWPQERCVRSFTQRIVNTTMCAGAYEGGRDACQVRFVLFAATKYRSRSVKACRLTRSLLPEGGSIDIRARNKEQTSKSGVVRLRLANQISLPGLQLLFSPEASKKEIVRNVRFSQRR